MMPRVVTLIAMFAALVTAPALAQVQSPLKPDASQGRELGDNRERETAHGVSLRPPVDTRIVRRTADEYTLRLADTAGQFTMSLLIKKTKKPLSLKTVTRSVQSQVLGVEMNVSGVPGHGSKDFRLRGRTALSGTNRGKIVAQRETVIAKRHATINYYQVFDNNNKPMLLAHAIIQLETQAFAILDIEGRLNPTDFSGSAKPIADTFERVIGSIEIENPLELSKRREQTVDLGHEWRSTLRLKNLHASLVPVQFYRFVETDKARRTKDNGWMRIRQFQSRKGTHNKPGVNVEVQLRIKAGDAYYDTLGEYFLADDDSLEMWSIHTTQRPANPRVKVNEKELPTFRQTGVRSDGVLTVTLDDPVSGQKKQSFAQPKKGYLSQVEGLMLPQILPHNQRATYGFYFYNTQSGSVAYREEQVVPTLTGFSIISRLTPASVQLTSTFNKQRRVIEKQLDTTGGKLLPTDAATIRRLWGVR